MSDPGPFGGIPFFGDLSRLLGRQGPVAWDAAGQLALSIATEGRPEPNVDPLERMRIEQLARVAEVQLAGAGVDTAPGGRVVTVEPVTRSQWVQRSLVAFRPRFEAIAAALGTGGDQGPPSTARPGSPAPQGPSAPGQADTAETNPPAEDQPIDPAFIGLEDLAGLGAEADAAAAAQPPTPEDGDGLEMGGDWLGGLIKVLSPMLLGMTAGSLVGHLSTTSFGLYDVPLPRHDAQLAVVASNLDAFGHDWSLDADDLRLWICLHELTHHAVLGRPHVTALLDDLVNRYASGFRPDPDALERRLGDLDPTRLESLASFQQILGDPEVLLGAGTSDAQAALRPRMDALVAAVAGYVDTVMDRVGERLIGSYGQVTEAVRRHRVESAEGGRFVAQLFGLDLSQDVYDRGSAFAAGVVERAGDAALERLWESEETLPTPAEVDAPGLWLARLDLGA